MDCFILCRLADDYDKHADEALVDAEVYLANPVNAYLFVKRFTTELPYVRELLSGSEESRNGNQTHSLTCSLSFPFLFCPLFKLF